jgi:V/A-type H+-transporting ATPase subunit I
MFTPSSMEIISILVEKDREKEIVSRLVKLGVFQPMDIKEAEDELNKVNAYSNPSEAESLSYIESRLNNITSKIDISNNPDSSELLNKVQILRIIEEMEDSLLPFLEKRIDVQNKIKTEETIYQQLSGWLPFPEYKPAKLSFLNAIVGKIDEKNLDVFKKSMGDTPYLFYPFRKENSKIVFFILLLKENSDILDEAFRTANCERVEEPAVANIKNPDEIKSSIEQNKKILDEITQDISSVVQKFRKDISRIQFFIKFERSLIEAKKFAYATENTILISGWIPSNKKYIILQELKNISQSSHYIESKQAEKTSIPKEKIPVSLTHSFLVRPFELITETYGLPRYGTIDPTLFLVLTFSIMFGAMYGDCGHGLVLALSGITIMKIKKQGGLQAGLLLLYCGISAIIFGLLYGSFFGIKFTPLWLDPMNTQSIMTLFKICIIVGIGLLSAGIGINIINSIKDRDYMKMFFDNAGLISGIFYWSVVGICFEFILKNQFPYFLIFLAIISIILLFLKPVFEKIFLKKKQRLISVFSETAPELMEVGMGYLTNTLSFLRIAAFALAHAGLLMAVFIIAHLLKNIAGGYITLPEIILGNIFIILLEGLVVGIQSVRLHYYEIFSRFFITGKEKYKPIQV